MYNEDKLIKSLTTDLLYKIRYVIQVALFRLYFIQNLMMA